MPWGRFMSPPRSTVSMPPVRSGAFGAAAVLGACSLFGCANDRPTDTRDPSAFVSGTGTGQGPIVGDGGILPMIGDGGSDGGSDGGGDGGTGIYSVTDVFDPASCSGVGLTQTTASPYLGLNTRVTLGQAQLMERTRTCSSPTSCGPWSTAHPYSLTLTTYSGGVTTHTKTFVFPTSLILWKASVSTLNYSVRSTPGVTHCPTCDTDGAVFAMGPLIPQISYPNIHLWDPTPNYPEDYQDLNFPLAPIGTLFVSGDCARFTARTNDSSAGVDDHTQELAALYALP